MFAFCSPTIIQFGTLVKSELKGGQTVRCAGLNSIANFPALFFDYYLGGHEGLG